MADQSLDFPRVGTYIGLFDVPVKMIQDASVSTFVEPSQPNAHIPYCRQMSLHGSTDHFARIAGAGITPRLFLFNISLTSKPHVGDGRKNITSG